jgi:hypothetical protein
MLPNPEVRELLSQAEELRARVKLRSALTLARDLCLGHTHLIMSG